MKKIKNFKTVLGVVIVGLTTLLPSCVQGDFSDLYDEELVWSNGIPRTKSGTDPGSDSPELANFGENECVTWSLCHIYSITYRGTDKITKDVKEIIVEQILNAYGITITNQMRKNRLSKCEAYLSICNNAGVNSSLIPQISESCGLEGYSKIDMPTANRAKEVEDFINSLTNFTVGKVLVRSVENNKFHVSILKSTVIRNGRVECMDKSSSSFQVQIDNIIGFVKQ